jgi:type II secretory pathway pseudopilin PulG
VARAPEDGFTLIELVVATGVMLAAVVAMLSTTLAGFQGIAVARRRQSANALANQAIEEIRALPFDTVTHGLGNTDLSATTDTRITKSGSGSTGVYTFGGEQIPHADNPTTTPVVPHQSTVVRNNLTYTVSAYLTFYQNVATSNTYRATVIVSWPSLTGSQSTSQVQVQTVLFSPIAGAKTCPSSKTHPFPAPCQPFLYGSASRSAGVISLSGTVSGIGLDHAALWLPSQSSSMQVEQTFAVQGSSQTSGATLQLTGQSEQSGGRQQVTSGADNDPAQSKPGYQTDSVGSQASGELDASGNNNQLSVLWGANDVAGTASTINASTSTDSSSPPKFGPCPLLVPSSSFDLSQNDNQPCGSSKGQQGGTLSTALRVATGSDTIALPLASVTTASASTASGGALTNRATASEGSVCPQASGDGCLQSKQYRSVGTVTLAQLPTNLSAGDYPTGYDATKGLVQLTGFSDSVSAEAGIGSAAPAATLSGTIRYYNGNGYGSLTLGPGASQAIPLGGAVNPGVVVSDPSFHGATLQLSIVANLATGAASTTDAGASSCGSGCRSTASATSASPIVGTIECTVTYDSSVVADVTTTVDLGTIAAKSAYTAAPSPG